MEDSGGMKMLNIGSGVPLGHVTCGARAAPSLTLINLTFGTKSPFSNMRACLSLSIFVFGLAALHAESAPPVTLPHTEQRSLFSKEIGQAFDLLVRLPDDYATS